MQDFPSSEGVSPARQERTEREREKRGGKSAEESDASKREGEERREDLPAHAPEEQVTERELAIRRQFSPAPVEAHPPHEVL